LTFVAKTVTLSNNPGNMELESTSCSQRNACRSASRWICAKASPSMR
jgi:hypothetical protein